MKQTTITYWYMYTHVWSKCTLHLFLWLTLSAKTRSIWICTEIKMALNLWYQKHIEMQCEVSMLISMFIDVSINIHNQCTIIAYYTCIYKYVHYNPCKPQDKTVTNGLQQIITFGYQKQYTCVYGRLILYM